MGHGQVEDVLAEQMIAGSVRSGDTVELAVEEDALVLAAKKE